MSKITYSNEVLGYHHAQTDCEAGIYLNDEIIGFSRYSLYSGTLYIDYIIIRPEQRRKGYGSRLFKYIQQKNPDYQYRPSMKTDDGVQFQPKNLSLHESAFVAYDNWMNESIKHLTPRSQEEIMANLDKIEGEVQIKRDLFIDFSRLTLCMFFDTDEEKLNKGQMLEKISDELKMFDYCIDKEYKPIVGDYGNYKAIDCHIKKCDVNESIKHLTPRSPEEIRRAEIESLKDKCNHQINLSFLLHKNTNKELVAELTEMLKIMKCYPNNVYYMTSYFQDFHIIDEILKEATTGYSEQKYSGTLYDYTIYPGIAVNANAIHENNPVEIWFFHYPKLMSILEKLDA